MGLTGRYITCSTADEPFNAFIPDPLPPNPPLELDDQDYDLMEKANRALGRLDGVTTLLPDPSLFIYFYVRKEALLSSQIEGTQSSFSDLLLFENDQKPKASIDEVLEVTNYIAAMNYGLERLRRDDFPLSLRLLREIHGVLLAKGRGSHKGPGEFRRSQNWIGGPRPGRARYVPPPPEYLMESLDNLEKFLQDIPNRTPVLIKAALAHVQFETIHPFLDGNGRLGRLLITLLLCSEDVLSEPLLYLSLYFKTNREEYYRHLQQVRTEGKWREWLRFFMQGVYETSRQATETAKAILRRFDEDRQKIEALGRLSGTALRVHQYIQRRPMLTVANVSRELEVTHPTARSAINALIKLGMLEEISNKKRDKIYLYLPYYNILVEGAEPLPR